MVIAVAISLSTYPQLRQPNTFLNNYMSLFLLSSVQSIFLFVSTSSSRVIDFPCRLEFTSYRVVRTQSLTFLGTVTVCMPTRNSR